MRRRCAAAVLLLTAAAAGAQTVTLNGRLGTRSALLVIDGRPLTVAVGASAGGVRLLSLSDGSAEVEVDGQRRRLLLGEPVKLAGTAVAATSGREIVLTAGPGGHFMAGGSINGRPVQFLVDTGATVVTLGQSEAERLGLDLSGAQRTSAQTANGPVSASLLMLGSVRVGDVEVPNVPALVLPAPMSHVLLGNSFLSRFQMRRDNDVMRLERR